jgi:hypothetical protein
MQLAAGFDAEGPAQAGLRRVGVDELDGADAALAEESQHGLHVVGRAVAQPHGRAFADLAAALRALAPQLRGVELVVLDKGGVEAAHAGEAADQRHLRDRQVGVGQQLLGGVQPVRLQILHGRDAELRLEDAPHVAVAHAQPGGELLDRGRFFGPDFGLVEQARGLVRQDVGGVLDGPHHRMRRQFGPAAQAGAEAGVLGLRRMVEETAVLALGCFHAADRPAVDAGRGHAGEKAAVETRVPRLQGEVAVVVGKRGGFAVHGEMIRRWPVLSTSRFRTCPSPLRGLAVFGDFREFRGDRNSLNGLPETAAAYRKRQGRHLQ